MTQEPFVFGREVTSSELVDRVEELEELMSVMRGGRRHFLIGPRRFGKTSLLSVATAQLRELGQAVVQVNAEEFATEAAFAEEVVKQAAKELKFSIREAGKNLLSAFGRLRPQVSYDGLRDSISVKLTLDETPEPTLLVTESLNGLDDLAKAHGRRIAVVIDEFQTLVAAEGIVAERQLRASIQRHKHLSYVFAGSDESMLIAMTTQHARPFYRLGSRRFLGSIPRTDFTEFINQAFERSGSQITPSAIESILDFADDVPYSIQRLALECWQLVRNRTKRQTSSNQIVLTPADVTERLEHLLAIEGPSYAASIALLTTNQQKALRYMAEVNSEVVVWQRAGKELKMSATSLQRAVESLIAKGYIRKVYGQQITKLFAFEDPFLKHYVLRSLNV